MPRGSGYNHCIVFGIAGYGVKRELPPTAGLAPRWRDLFDHPDRPVGSSGSVMSRPRHAAQQFFKRLTLSTSKSARADGADGQHDNHDHVLSRHLAQSIGTDDVVMVNSGFAALVIAFEYLKKGALGREVILPAFTSPKVAMAAHRAGLSVRLCDTGQSRFDFDLGMLARLVGGQTLAIVPTHFGGHITPIAPLKVLLQGIAPHVVLVEDAAQAFGARVRGQPVGLAGDLGLFSFARGTGLTLFQGGCLVSDNPIILKGLKNLAARMQPPSWRHEWRQCLGLLAYHAFYDAEHYRLVYGAASHRKGSSLPRYALYGEDDWSALPLHRLGAWRQQVGFNALQRLDTHRQAVAGRVARLLSVLQSVPRSEVHVPPAGVSPSFGFLFVSMASRKQADRVLAQSIGEGLGVSRLFAGPLTAYPALKGIIPPDPMPQAEALAARTLTVTTSPLMTDGEIEKIGRLFRNAGKDF